MYKLGNNGCLPNRQGAGTVFPVFFDSRLNVLTRSDKMIRTSNLILSHTTVIYV